MKRVILALLVAFVATEVNGQDISPELLRANLALQIPQLREVEFEMGAITESPITGLHQGSFTIEGQQEYTFLLSMEEKLLYLVALGPLEVGLSEDEIAARLEQERTQAEATVRERSADLETFVEGMPVRGSVDAPVTIIEFSDFQCPYCARSATVVEELLEKHPGEVKFVFLHFPLDFHSWAKPAAIASVCAAEQSDEAFWALHDSYFRNQSAITDENLMEKSRGFLADSGIDLNGWSACASDDGSLAYQGALLEVETSMAKGSAYGITGTPGFFVNGRYLNGSQPLGVFEELINEIRERE